MKKLLFSAALILSLTAGIIYYSQAMQNKDSVRHVVVFKYKPDAPASKIQQVNDNFRALKDKIPGILAFEHGVNDSPEEKNMGFTHVYLLTFEDAAARDAYLPHPEHKKFGEKLGALGILEDVFVVDYAPQP
ncbi:MAG: Dabb family protein [Cyclobacteriaceae bacterium]